MTVEELKQMIGEVVTEKIKPLEETQRKYADQLDNQHKEGDHEAKGEELEPGIRLARCAKLLVLAKNDPEKALYFAKDAKNPMYPDDLDLHKTLKDMSESTPSEGGFLVPERYAAEVIPLLYAKAVVRQLGARSQDLVGGNLTIPKVVGGATAYYIGEQQNIKKSNAKFGNLKLSAKKLATLVPISNDLLRANTYNADAIVRDDLVQAMALKEDWAAMYGPGTEFAPLGIKNTKGVDQENLGAVPDADLTGIMIGEMLTRNLPWTAPGWAFNGALWSVFYNMKDANGHYIYRDEMNNGKLNGIPYAISNQILYNNDAHGTTDLFLGDWSELIIGEEMTLEMAASTEAAYFDGTQLQSAFSRDETILRVISKHDFGIRHEQAFVVKTNVYSK